MSRKRKTQGPLAGALWAKNLGRDFPSLTMSDRAVGLLLTHYADYQTGKGARPSQETLAESLGISERTVRAALKRLEDAGAISCSGRHHRVKVYDLLLCNRHGASAYEEVKAAAESDVTGSHTSDNRNGASDNHSEHPDRKGGSEEEGQERARLELAHPALTEHRLVALTQLLPESWEGAALRRSHPALVEAVAELDAAGWNPQQIRLGLSTLGALRSVKNPSAVLATHLRQMLAAGPSDVVTVAKAEALPWQDGKRLSDFSKALGMKSYDLKELCAVLAHAGYEIDFSRKMSPLGQISWEIFVEDPRIPPGYGEWFVCLDEESVYVSGGDCASAEPWSLERGYRTQHEEGLRRYSQDILDELPWRLNTISQQVLLWYAENEPLALTEHLKAKGLVPAEESA